MSTLPRPNFLLHRTVHHSTIPDNNTYVLLYCSHKSLPLCVRILEQNAILSYGYIFHVSYKQHRLWSYRCGCV